MMTEAAQARASAWIRPASTLRPAGRPQQETPMSESENAELERLANREYQYGFVTDIESETIPPGLDESVVRLISAKKQEPEWLLEWRLRALHRFLELLEHETEPTWAHVSYPEDRLPEDHLLLGAQAEGEAREPRRGRSGAARHLREARHLALGAEAARGRRRRRGVRQRLGRHHVQGGAREARHRVLLVLRGGAEAPRARAPVPGLGRALLRQLLRVPELRRVQRRLVRLHAEGRALPDGALDLLPDQLGGDRPVRAHADRRRRGRLRVLPRGLHRADARREPAPRRRGRARRARRRPDQVLDRAELVPGRQGGQGRDLQLRHQARRVPRQALEDLVDPGGDGLGDHLEVPELHPPGRRLGGRVLLGGDDQPPPAGRHRHEDDPHREEHEEHDHLEGHLRGPRPAVLPRPGADRAEGARARATTRSATRCCSATSAARTRSPTSR